MDTGASSHLNSNASNLSTIFNQSLFSYVHVGDGNFIPVTNTGHSIIPSLHRLLHLHNVLDFLTRHILLRCDSSGDLYLVNKPSTSPTTFLSTSASTWHQRLSHPGDEVLRSLVSSRFISCNKEKTPHLSHVCQLGKHVKLPFYSSDSIVENCFDFIHSDLWTSPIMTLFLPLPLQHYYSIASLHKEFDMTDLEALNYFLGISANRSSTGLFLSQRKYALQLLERAHMVNCNPSRTPVDTESKLGPEGVLVQDPTLYRSLVGELQYLTFTHLDLSYAIQQVCLYMHDPRDPHFAALKRILCYVRGIVDFGLQLYASATNSLVGYTDADWAGCPSTHRSTSGYCVFLGDNLLSWLAKRQHTLSRSSTEAEYRGVANIVAETAWLHNLLRELHSSLSTATLVYCDNISAVYMSANPVQHQRTKHIDIDIHFIHDMVTAGQVRVLHVPSRYQYVDIFTKGIPSALFEEFRSSLSVHPPPALTAGAY
ncbi:ribonuclease H-like domain-containing protein [Tanacetum coccineum]